MRRVLTIVSAAIILVFGIAAPTVAQEYYESAIDCSAYASIEGAPGAVVLSSVSGCDDCTQLISLPFTFYWFGDTPVTQMQVSSNGQLNVSPSDVNSNCCLADPVVVGPPYLSPRIAIAQEDLHPGRRGTIWALDTGSSYIIDFVHVDFFGVVGGDVNAQAELYPNGDIELRWDDMWSDNDNIAAGVEDDTRAVPSATAASGAPFGSGGIVLAAELPSLQGQCRLFSTFTNEPPDCSNAAADPAELWPPNHWFVDVSVVGVTDPDGDPITITIDSIFQDERVESEGDGNTCPDAGGVGTSIASIRSERSGRPGERGDGRVYTVAFTADDGNGGTCAGTLEVCVPHDQSPRGCTLSAGSYDSTACASAKALD